MVRPNCANTNAKIHAPSFIRSAGPKIDVQCTLPCRGRRNGLRAGSRASGGRAGLGRCARVSDAHPRDARPRRFRSRVASAATDRARIPASADSTRAPRQRPASSRTTRKDSW
jgi:hypothetical protein